MDLPTYTSIWRIEKRLYKLYDFRLPMPVPVGQIAVFAAITVMVWSEALRNPALAAQLTGLCHEMGAYYGGLATDIRLPKGVPAESFATVLGSISAGFILQLALFGPGAAEDLPATARALWPAARPDPSALR